MSHFFASSAFLNVAPERLAEETVGYCAQHGIRAKIVTEPHPVNERADALFYAPSSAWTVVTWPTYFNIHDVRLCAEVTRVLKTVAVTVNVYEGEFWSLEVLDSGRLADRFSPRGDYFSADEAAATADREKWRGNPKTVAALVGCSSDQVAPYYRHAGAEEVGKIHVDDAFPLENFWVFTDIWRKFGAVYPDSPDAFSVRVRLPRQFGDKLPTWEGEDL